MSAGIANIASASWRLVESGKPSASLVSNACTALPAGDPYAVTAPQGPNSVVWRLRKSNGFGLDVVDVLFDLRWEFGARYRGGGAYIPNCYLNVPRCNVLWGFTVDVHIAVHNPVDGGDGGAPLACLPLTVSGTVTSLVGAEPVQWDFVLYGDGSYRAG